MRRRLLEGPLMSVRDGGGGDAAADDGGAHMAGDHARDSQQKSHGNMEGMVTILGSFDHRLTALEAAMRPTQVRTHAIRLAHENIDKTLKAADRHPFEV